MILKLKINTPWVRCVLLTGLETNDKLEGEMTIDLERYNLVVGRDQLTGPMARTHWDDANFDTYPVRDCREPLEIMSDIAGWNALARGAKPRVSPFWGKGTGALKGGLMIGRQSLYGALKAINIVLAPYDLELLLVEAMRTAKMQATGFSDVFWRPEGQPMDPWAVISRMPLPDFLARAYAARKGYLENGIVCEGEIYERTLMEVRTRRANEIVHAAASLGKSPRTVEKWVIKYYANLLGSAYGVLDVAGNRPHGTGAVVDAVLMSKSTKLPVFMGSPSDSTRPDSALATLDYFENHTFADYIAELDEDDVAMAFLADFAADYGTDQPTMEHWRDAKLRRRMMFNAFHYVTGAGGYNVGPNDGEFWHFTVPMMPGGPGDATWMDMMKRDRELEPAVFGSEFAHTEVARLIGPEYVY